MVVEVPDKSKNEHFAWDIRKNCVFQRFASLGCLGRCWGGLGRSRSGFWGSWGSLKACWGRLAGWVGRGLDALEPVREASEKRLGVSSSFLHDFVWILVHFGKGFGTQDG